MISRFLVLVSGMTLMLGGWVGLVPRASATCGSDMCTVDLRGPESVFNRYSLELAYQHIDQSDVRVGTEPGIVGQIPAHHNEVSTRTDQWAMIGRAVLSPKIVVSATLPYMDRTHVHQEEHIPGEIEEHRWDYSGFGDLLTTAYWSMGRLFMPAPYGFSLQGGVKAPTGRKDVPEVEGEQPEPMARPSTGSWDVLAGGQLRRVVYTKGLDGSKLPVTYSLGLTGRFNGHGTDDFKAGNEWVTSLAGGWALSPSVTILAQLNSRWRDKDSAGNTDTEPNNTGGTAIYGTPGVRLAMGSIAAYTYYQMRLYENVNGIQITAPQHFMAGMSYLF